MVSLDLDYLVLGLRALRVLETRFVLATERGGIGTD